MNQEISFPPDLWAFHRIGSTQASWAELSGRLDDLEHAIGAPRDPALLERFCRVGLPQGSILIVGAGTHTERLLHFLQAIPAIRPIAIVDRLAERFDECFGLPVISAETAATRYTEPLILSHTIQEREMTTQLIEAGVTADRITPIYTHPVYQALARDWVAELLDDISASDYDFVLIETTQSELIQRAELIKILPPNRTLRIYVGRNRSEAQCNDYTSIDLHESMSALRAVLDAINPKAIYLKPIIYKNYLAALIRRWRPETRLVVEFYDMSILWSDQAMSQWFGLDDLAIRTLRLAEHVAIAECEFILAKQGGPHWDSVISTMNAKTHLYYPCVQSTLKADLSSPMPVEPQTRPIRIVYAGVLPAPVFVEELTGHYNFLPLFKELVASGEFAVDIYNSLHNGEQWDRTFERYLVEYNHGDLRYFRRVGYDALLDRLSEYDWGWLCQHATEYQGDIFTVVGNRLTGYISGLLPVLISPEWVFSGALLQRFGAGAIVADSSVEGVRSAVRGVRRERLIDGARALREHMRMHNSSVLAELTRYISRPPEDASTYAVGGLEALSVGRSG